MAWSLLIIHFCKLFWEGVLYIPPKNQIHGVLYLSSASWGVDMHISMKREDTEKWAAWMTNSTSTIKMVNVTKVTLYSWIFRKPKQSEFWLFLFCHLVKDIAYSCDNFMLVWPNNAAMVTITLRLRIEQRNTFSICLNVYLCPLLRKRNVNIESTTRKHRTPPTVQDKRE